MKSIFFKSLLVIVFFNIQCSKSDSKTSNLITIQQLEVKKQEIVSYISRFNCSATVGCNSIAFGSKACGGPKEYLVFPNTVDLDFLRNKVNQYNALEAQYNIQTNAVSDCMLVMPPENIGCVNNVCTILD